MTILFFWVELTIYYNHSYHRGVRHHTYQAVRGIIDLMHLDFLVTNNFKSQAAKIPILNMVSLN